MVQPIGVYWFIFYKKNKPFKEQSAVMIGATVDKTVIKVISEFYLRLYFQTCNLLSQCYTIIAVV